MCLKEYRQSSQTELAVSPGTCWLLTSASLDSVRVPLCKISSNAVIFACFIWKMSKISSNAVILTLNQCTTRNFAPNPIKISTNPCTTGIFAHFRANLKQLWNNSNFCSFRHQVWKTVNSSLEVFLRVLICLLPIAGSLRYVHLCNALHITILCDEAEERCGIT